MTFKKVFSAPDAAPSVLYVKRDADSEHAFPLLEKWFNPPVYEYRAEYDGSGNAIYEGWAEWVGGGNLATDLVWKISKNVYSGGNKTHQMFAGSGGFEHAWDARVTYFPVEGIINKVFMDENNMIFQDGENYIFREA
jgi:hypothetical protein